MARKQASAKRARPSTAAVAASPSSIFHNSSLPMLAHTSISTYNNRSPPRTPKRASRGVEINGKAIVRPARARPAVWDTFVDDLNSGEPLQHQLQHRRQRSTSDTHRNSQDQDHELSWPRNNPASVVDNMLLSLDQLGANEHSTMMLGATRGTETSETFRRGYGHRVSTSTSSVLSLPTESGLHHVRSHRSNSSGTFQSSLGRIDSLRNQTRAAFPLARGLEDRKSIGTEASTRARKGSKSSINSSLDLSTQRVNGVRWQGAKARSSSLDQTYDRGIFDFPTSSVPSVPLTTALLPTMAYDNYEAAPTPTIPGGPSHKSSSNAISQMRINAAAQQVKSPLTDAITSATSTSTPTPKRPILSNMMKEGLSASQSKSKEMNIHQTPRSRDRGDAPDFTDPEINPSSSFQIIPSSATAPSSSTPARERPGFFRRVFGGSARNTSERGHAPIDPTISITTRVDYHDSHSKLSKPPPNLPSRAPSREQVPPAVLNKKPSFFRRRKKSISEVNVPPLPRAQMPTHSAYDHHPQDGTPLRGTSPTGSLHNVMSPYLHDGRAEDASMRIHEMDSMATLTPDISNSMASRSHLVNPGYNHSSNHPSNDQSTVRVIPNADTSWVGVTSRQDINSQDESYRDHSSITSPPLHLSSTDSPSASRPAISMKENEGAVPRGSASLSNMPSDVSSGRNPDLLPRRLDGKSDIKGKEMPVSSSIKPLEPRDLNIPKPFATPTNVAGDKHAMSSPSRSAPRTPVTPVDDDVSDEAIAANDFPTHKNSMTSAVSDYQSASSALHSPALAVHSPTSATQSPSTTARLDPTTELVDEPDIIDEPEPSAEDRAIAQAIFDGTSESINRISTVPWLGDQKPGRAQILQAYFDLFPWQNLNLLTAMRDLCSHLTVKGESQQMARILDAFTFRWSACNPNHGFKSIDILHTLSYSLILLNTDLHTRDHGKMTRTEYVDNTISSLHKTALTLEPPAIDTLQASKPPLDRSANHASGEMATSTRSGSGSDRPPEISRLRKRLSIRPSAGDKATMDHGAIVHTSANDPSGPLVKAPFVGDLSRWEVQVEIVLKDFFNSIRHEPLPLFTDESHRSNALLAPSASLSTIAGGILRRTPSLLSKTGSENQSIRGRPFDGRSSRWTSKARSHPRLYPPSLRQSSHVSFDDDDSAVATPSIASMWSKYSFGRTPASLSVHSLASGYPHADYQPSIGFANALSQAIIREDAAAAAAASTAPESPSDEPLREAPLLEDESLSLLGAPWAKEGTLQHKHHLEAEDKRARERGWNEVFCVIDKGWLRLFNFSTSSRSLRTRLRLHHAPGAGATVGGGNWTENAEAVGSFLLRQTIASVLPPPGYSKARSHVWALSLPTGGLHLFHAGTPEIVREFVCSANYWSARLSKEPLVGGVSNIEYGWSDAILNMSTMHGGNSEVNSGDGLAAWVSSSQLARPSFQASVRSSMEHGGGGSIRPRLPGDRVIVQDWTPPTQSMVASALMEVDQLRALTTYVKNVENDLQRHNEMRGAMLLAFTPRHPTHTKAMLNWERKSSYLLRESTKFRTYIDTLQAAQAQKERVYAERKAKAAEQAERKADVEDPNDLSKPETLRDALRTTETGASKLKVAATNGHDDDDNDDDEGDDEEEEEVTDAMEDDDVHDERKGKGKGKVTSDGMEDVTTMASEPELTATPLDPTW